METKTNYLMAGCFVIGLTISLFIFILWMANHGDHKSYTPYAIYFNGSVSGLERGSAVRFRGIPVGNVTNVSVDPSNIELIKVVVRVTTDTPIKVNTVATLNYQGVTGITYVELIGGTQEAQPLMKEKDEDYAVIRSQSSDINKVIETAPEMIDKFTKVADRAALLLNDKNLASFSALMTNLQNVSATLANRSADIDKLISNASQATERINVIADTLSTKLPETLNGLELTSRDLADTSRSIKEIITTNQGQIAANILDLDKLLKDSNNTVRNADTLVRNISEHPASLLFSSDRKGMKVAP